MVPIQVRPLRIPRRRRMRFRRFLLVLRPWREHQSIQHAQYDYSTGLLTGFRDRNDVISQTIYDDPFNRPTLVKSALGVAGVETHTTNYYAPITAFGITLAKNDTLTASDLTGMTTRT